ncbi:MAG: hypothetical protein ACLFS1_02465 [Opitutales bacterium]
MTSTKRCFWLLPLLFWAQLPAEPVNLLNPPPEAPHPVRLVLQLDGVRPIGDSAGHLFLTIRSPRHEPEIRAAADYNERSQNEVNLRSWSWQRDQIEASLQVEIGPDGARRGRAHFPNPPDVFEISLQADLLGEDAERAENREAFMPGWRKDTPQLGGRAVRGRYQGSWISEGEPVELSGDLKGSWTHDVVPESWGAVGPGWVGSVNDRVHLRAFLPETTRVEGVSAWAETGWSTPLPLPPKGKIRLSASGSAGQPPVALSIQLRTERGWFSRYHALPLGSEPAAAEIDLEDFGSRWRPFGGSELQALRIGVLNGDGVGTVDLFLSELQLIPGSTDIDPSPVRLTLSPDTTKKFNGVERVPKGLFGFHDVNENKPRKPKAGEPDPVEMMRLLNPGSLRPLTHTGFGGDPLSEEAIARRMDLKQRDAQPPDHPFYRRAVAGNAVDQIIRTHTMDLWSRPPWLERGVAPLARDLEVFYRNLASKAWIPGDQHNLLRYLEVWNEPFMWGRHINMGFRRPPGVTDVKDETQYGYIPGKVGADAWSELFLAAARGARSVNPHVKLGGPSAPHFNSYDYMDFRNYTLRILERTGDQLDFITEHHYGGDPLTVAAGYEVVRSAMWTLHGRSIPIFNTEANDLGASDAGKAAYNLAEILDLIQTNPDIARARALHACWSGYLRSQGERHAYRLAAPLRGLMIDLEVDSPRITAVAAHPKMGELVLVGVDHGIGNTDVQVPVPEGFSVEECILLLAESPLEELQIRDVDGARIPAPAEGRTEWVDARPEVDAGTLHFRIPERSAFRITLKREGYTPGKTRARTLVPLPLLFKSLAPGAALALPVDQLDPDAERVFLRLVHTGKAAIKYGSKTIPLPAGADRSSHAEVIDIPLDGEILESRPQLEADTPVEILSASWITEQTAARSSERTQRVKRRTPANNQKAD